MKLKIDIENINDKFNIEVKSINKIVELIFIHEKKEQGNISIVFVDHTYIEELNEKFLGRSYSTDVITFPLSEDCEESVEAEIYINLDIVAENAVNYNVTFDEEVSRIVIHGVLHLLNYDDGDADSRNRMTRREDYYLKMMADW